MFSGIITEIGRIAAIDPASITITCARVLDGLPRGGSVAVNGVCLTAAAIDAGSFSADLMPETLRRSTLHGLTPGTEVNLEAALKFGQEVGGHLIQGHVDGTGEVVEVRDEGNARWVTIRVPAAVAPYCVAQGSIAVDGTSLTIAEQRGDRVAVSLIPHTLERTVARAYAPGSRVNLEADILAKYVARYVAGGPDSTGPTPSGGHPTPERSGERDN